MSINIAQVQQGINNFLGTFGVVRAHKEVLDRLIEDAEILFPEKGSGQAKLQYVREQMNNVWGYVDKLGMTVTALWAVAQPIITLLVARKNAAGWVKPEPVAPAPAPVASEPAAPQAPVKPAAPRRR